MSYLLLEWLLNFEPLIDYILFVCESVFNTWFSIELLLRFLSCPEKFKFVKDWLNIIDLIAIMPYFVMLSASSTTKGSSSSFGSALKIFRLTRIVRIFKLSSYSRSLRILATTMYHSAPMLFQLVIIQERFLNVDPHPRHRHISISVFFLYLGWIKTEVLKNAFWSFL